MKGAAVAITRNYFGGAIGCLERSLLMAVRKARILISLAETGVKNFCSDVVDKGRIQCGVYKEWNSRWAIWMVGRETSRIPAPVLYFKI